MNPNRAKILPKTSSKLTNNDDKNSLISTAIIEIYNAELH